MLDFNKMNGLLPVVIQDAVTGKVLMLGFMNQEAYDKTVKEKRVTFFSRSKNRLWTKGETSGNFLDVTEIIPDCDNDTLLIKVKPKGPACHTGAETCFKQSPGSDISFLHELEEIIKNRKLCTDKNSYTSQLFKSGLNRIAQKVGEEAVEVVIASKEIDTLKFTEEAADLLFHFMVLLQEKGIFLSDVVNLLKIRNKK